ncbi:MAG: Holliday junction branch migration protein RuvA [Bacteroidetes bacterium TMED284]|nr:Holliday junction branch migration protein RuvA [Balneola sp.]OUX48988.1 MAG: Holliday junction branch migration protein RuvA [Bacteroidetes bacterium TMED284]
MIRFLEGVLEEKKDLGVLVNVHGVGYGLSCSQFTLEELPATGEKVRLLVYHHITDSDQRLFGFNSTAEKILFEQLITVKGVGPKLGVTILSGMPINELMSAIINGQAGILSKIPGIGKKSAERIILELREKVADTSARGEGIEGGGESGFNNVTMEAVQALCSLGFRVKDAEEVVAKIQKSGQDAGLSDLIKQSLKALKS